MPTKPHESLDSSARDRLTLHLLGGMNEDEERDLDRHLDSCALCRREVRALRPVVDGLALAAPEAEPPPELFGRLMDRVGRKPFTLDQAVERKWVLASPGVEICQLWLDAERERQTVLIRMQAGSSLPRHIHGATEECFIVRGEIRNGDIVLGATDYVRFERGTSHTATTDAGCLLLVNSSLKDRAQTPHDEG